MAISWNGVGIRTRYLEIATSAFGLLAMTAVVDSWLYILYLCSPRYV